MKILVFGSYDPHYSRNKVLLKGLRDNGVSLIECNEHDRSILKFFKLFFRYIMSGYQYDVMFVPFPGHEVMLLARLLTRKPIVFSAFTSHYEGYILDRNKYSPTSLPAWWYQWIDMMSCRLADLVILDTNAHINFFVKMFGLPEDKFRRIFVGTDTDTMKPASPAYAHSTFSVCFYGHYIPLQGVEYIIRAASILKKENIKFTLIGSGQTFPNDRKLADSLGVSNITFVEKVPYVDLASYINGADVSLGIFGNTPKTQTVIPNKVYDGLACQKPVVTARTAAIAELLTDRQNVVLCNTADPQDLADAILFFKKNPDKAEAIAQAGHELFMKELTEKVLGAQLLIFMKELL